MATAAQLVAKAAGEIGTKESPAGSNKVKYAKWYGMNGQPWCDMFVSWCADQVGASNAVGKYAYCPYHVNFFKNATNGAQWLGRTSNPKAGDIVFFSNGTRACHVGIVEKRLSATSVQTIEGNTSTSSNDNGGCVMRRSRSYGTVGSSWYVLGFGRPKFDSVASGGSNSGSTSSTTTTKSSGSGEEVYGFAYVQNGSSGNVVKMVQAALNVRNSAGLSVDGSCGANTTRAIKAYQKKHGLSQDGIVGPKTYSALLAK